MITLKDLMLQHVPMKLESVDEQAEEDLKQEEEEETQQPQPEQPSAAAAVNGAVAESEQDTDETDESEADDAIDDEATLLISSEEEAELEAQRIRFHELLAKSLLRENAGARSGSVSGIDSSGSANDSRNSSRASSILCGTRLRSRRCSNANTSGSFTVQALSDKTTKQQLEQKQQKQQQRQGQGHGQLQQQQEETQQQQELAEAAPTAAGQRPNKKQRGKRGTSTSSRASLQASSTTSQSEGCGCILIYNGQNKLIFNCGLCDNRYEALNAYAKHLYNSHKLIDDQNIEVAAEPAIDIKTEVQTEEDTPLPAPGATVNQELCGNIFALQRKKIYVGCGYCECRYANLDLFQKHLRQQHKLLQTSTEPTREVSSDAVVVLPTKNEIKTEVYVITDLPVTNTALNISPRSDTTSSSDQPMVIIPQENGIIKLQEEDHRQAEQKTTQEELACDRLLNAEINDNERADNELASPTSTTIVLDTATPIALPSESIAQNLECVMDADTKQNDAMVEDEVELKVNDIVNSAQLMATAANANEATQVPVAPIKQTALKASKKRRNIKQQEQQQSLQHDVVNDNKIAGKIGEVEESEDASAKANGTRKKRERPKRQTKSTTTTTTTTVTTTTTTQNARAKRQRKNNKTAALSTPKPIATATATGIHAPVPTELQLQHEAAHENALEQNQEQANESPAGEQQTAAMDVDDDPGEDQKTMQATSEFQQSVAEFFKKFSESPKAAVVRSPSLTESNNPMTNPNDQQIVALIESKEVVASSTTTTPTTAQNTNETIPLPSITITPSSPSSMSSSTPSLYGFTPNGTPYDRKNDLPTDTKLRSTKSAKNQYQCEYCLKSFAKLSRCLEHTRLHTGEKPFRCDICSREFRLKMRLNEHQLRHREERAFKCDICGLALATKQDLHQHLRHHKGDRRFQCAQCPKAFVRGSDLKIHERVHTGEKPYTCEVCNKKFRANQNLIVHRRSHTLEKNFPCEICNKRFMRKVDRKVHMRTHTGEKPFKCEICQRGYSSRVHVRAHLEREHVLAVCGLKPERKKTGPKPKQLRESLTKEKQKNEQKQIENGQELNDGKVKAEQQEQKQHDEQNCIEITQLNEKIDSKVEDNLVALPKSTRREMINEKPQITRRVGTRKLAIATTISNTTPLPPTRANVAATVTSATNKRTTAKKSTTTTTPPQHLSVTVSKQVESVAADDDDIADDDDDANDEAMPEKENDNSMLSAAGVAVPTVAANTGNSPLKTHVKKERTKITSYFTVVGQKSEI